MRVPKVRLGLVSDGLVALNSARKQPPVAVISCVTFHLDYHLCSTIDDSPNESDPKISSSYPSRFLVRTCYRKKLLVRARSSPVVSPTSKNEFEINFMNILVQQLRYMSPKVIAFTRERSSQISPLAPQHLHLQLRSALQHTPPRSSPPPLQMPK